MSTGYRKKILGIGAGYVGGPTMAFIASKCPDYKITVVDINSDKIAAWQSDDLPVYEPGLLEVVQEARGRNLFFSTDIAAEIEEADIIFVTVNTPVKSFGEGAGKAPDLQYWEKTARNILAASKTDKIVVEKSTLPVRTAEALEGILHSGDTGVHFDVLSNPEFLAEGEAIENLENPDRVLIGSRENERGRTARQAVVDIYKHWVDEDKIITSNVWSAELSKLTANGFLAQRLSSINSISALCEKTGADIEEVAHAIGTDSRIGAKFLKTGPGFGGSCFKKDILNLVYICESYGLTEVAQYWESVVAMNDYQRNRISQQVIKALFNTVSDKRIALFGFAFKANTSDTRETSSLAIARYLLAEHAQIVITDPQALANAQLDLKDNEDICGFEEDPYAASEGASAIIVCTEWDQYRALDYKRIYASMEKPAFLFDTRNLLDHQALFDIGFNVYPIGKAPLIHSDT